MSVVMLVICPFLFWSPFFLSAEVVSNEDRLIEKLNLSKYRKGSRDGIQIPFLLLPLSSLKEKTSTSNRRCSKAFPENKLLKEYTTEETRYSVGPRQDI